jgi:hypothetical protein
MKYKGVVITKGSKDSESVKAIKVKLNERTWSRLDTTNGNFGTSTESVVKEFQRTNQLRQDGEIGELTWERLFTVSYEQPVISQDLISRVREIADTQLFVREKTGKNDGVEVEKYLKSVGLGKGWAWCMAYFFWLFETASIDLGIKNPVPKTAGVLDCLAKAKAAGLTVTLRPKVGDQFIMDFGGGKGHTGLVEEVRGNRVFTNEGNTSADPTYAGEDREGNGVFERSRLISTIKAFIRYA